MYFEISYSLHGMVHRNGVGATLGTDENLAAVTLLRKRELRRGASGPYGESPGCGEGDPDLKNPGPFYRQRKLATSEVMNRGVDGNPTTAMGR